jgi:hypothetical protein
MGDQIDYGMRVYDPRAGRFLSVDPLTKDYAELTPYQYASNSPIFNIDLDGLEATSWWSRFWADPVNTLMVGTTWDDANSAAADINNQTPVGAVINGTFQAVTGRDPATLQPGASRIDGLGNAVIGAIFHKVGTNLATPSSSAAKLEREMAENAAAATNKSATAAHGTTEAKETNTANTEKSNLQKRAQEVHEKQSSFAQRKTTTAVGEGVTESGEKVRLVSSSNARLSPAQRAALKPGETHVNNKSLNFRSKVRIHAEQKVTLYARLNNIKLSAVAPSRPACPACVISVENSGAQLDGAIKKVPSQSQP